MTIAQEQTDEQPVYSLVIWFDQKQAEVNDLFRFANTGLITDVDKKVGFSTEGYLTLSLTGKLESVDKGHAQIIEFVEKKNWNLFRVIDTAGDEIRRKAFSELSIIEQELRAFINRGLIETLGFDWWLSLGSLKIPGRDVSETQKTHHPLELMTIEELVGIVTFDRSEWNEDGPVALKDIIHLLEESNNFDDFRGALLQKAKRISLWDLVFSKYLGDSASLWQEIRKKDLQFIIELRNKVMHHRPVHLGELRALDERRKKVNSLIASAKSHLSDEEKQDIGLLKKQARDIFSQLVYERGSQNAFSRLHSSLNQSRNKATIQNLNNEIAALITLGTLSTKEALELQAVAFNQLEIVTNYILDQTQEIIINELLPLCLQEEPEIRLQSRSFRNILADWINNHPQQDALALKNLALDHLVNHIGTSKHKTACWTISRLGFTRNDITQRLLEYATSNDNETGDETFSTLTWLNLSQEQHGVILEQIHHRTEKRYNNSLVWALARLADPSSVPVIFEQWFQGGNITQKNVDASLAFTALREIADANENNTPMQNDIWHRASEAVESHNDDLYTAFDIGHLVTTCNSEYVVATLLRWHGQHPEWFQNPGWARYLAQERLADSVKPLQLDGWAHIDDMKIFEYLQNDACSNTNDDNFYTTQESITKESAWKTLLRAGYAEALTWFEPAVSNETGRFVRQKVMEYLAAFKIEPLPETAVRWITEEFNDAAETDGRELSYRMAAVRLAGNSVSWNAFEALLNFGYTRKGQVLQQSADAVAGMSISLLRQGQTEIIERLAQSATSSTVARQRLVSINALEIIATFPEYQPLLEPYRDQFIALLYEEKLENIERGQLLSILAYLPGDISEALEKDLVTWTRQQDRWVSVGSLQALALHDKLETNPELMQELLGLEKHGKSWILLPGESKLEWGAYIIGLLYHRNISAYTNVVSTLVATKDWNTTIQILGWLDTTHSGDGKPRLPNEIVNGLLQRLASKMSRLYSESETFDALARMAPDALVSPIMSNAIPNWMPDSSIALANALRKAVISQDVLKESLAVLESLTEDGMYSVRRAAYRALAKHSTMYLYGLCKSWLDSPILKLNLRAGEACGWVENVNVEGQDWFQELRILASNHPESSVREAVRRSSDERRRRQWAKIYLEKIISVTGQDNNELLQTWRYGDALSQVGNDETRDALRDHLSSKQLPPNIRFWISKHILEKLDNNWKKVTQKWPEPWVDSHGTFYRGKGNLILGPEKSIDVQYSIWLNPASKPGEKHSWGGNLIAFWGDVLNIEQAVLELENGRQGTVYLSSITGNTVTFLGTGSYPS